MEKTIAYKSFDGKFFGTEDECLAYEEFISQFPKREIEIKPQIDGIEKYFIEEQKKPRSPKRKYFFFAIKNLYKVMVNSGSYLHDIESIEIKDEWQPLEKIACKVIYDNETFNDDLAKEICEIYNKCAYKSKFINTNILECVVTDTDHETYWVIEDKGWQTGLIGINGRYIRIEKM